MENTRRYAVITCDSCHLDSLYDDLETAGGNEYIPEREVVCAERKPNSKITLYELTEEEANNLQNDSRISYIDDYDQSNAQDIHVLDYEQSSTKFDKGASQNAEHINWGLLRCTEGENRYAWGADGIPTQTGIATVTCSGRNVDVVIVDTAMDGDHPEFAVNADGTGGSRFVRYNWFQHRSAVNSSHPANYDYDAHLAAGTSDHSTHCAGTVAGNTQGWARDANIYNIDVFGVASGNVARIDGTDAFQYIKEFHENKPVNPVTGRRNPTIVNNSWSVQTERHRVTHVSAASTGRPMEQVEWRGTTYDGPFTIDQLESYGIMQATDTGGQYGQGTVMAGSQNVSMIVAAQEMIDAGVISCGSAGNQKYKICKLSTEDDWDNNYKGDFLSSFSGTYVRGSQYYHRGQSVGAPPMDSYPNPTTFPQKSPILVGATNSAVVDAKRSFSNCGPRVDVFGPGTNIQSARHSAFFITDPRNSSYGLAKQNGTSMSCPQITGLLACVLELYPRATPAEIRTYMETYWKQDQLLDTAGSYTDENSLQGAANLYAFHEPERDREGVLVPRIGEWFRPTEGQLWPRKRYLY